MLSLMYVMRLSVDGVHAIYLQIGILRLKGLV